MVDSTRLADGCKNPEAPHLKGRLAICAILKNEARNILEWIAYHRVIGVEKFFLYDNNSTDHVRDIVAPLVAEDIVSYRFWPINPGQNEAYAHYVDISWDDFEWTAFIDLDEFIHPLAGRSLADWLDRFEGAAAVSLHWINFGASGNREPPQGMMLGAYDRRLPDDATTHQHVKTIIRTKTFIRCHTPHAFEVIGKVVREDGTPAIKREVDGDYSIQPLRENHEACINHYYTRSALEWTEKVGRGMADSALGSPNRRPMEWFDYYEREAIVEDRRIMRYLPEVQAELDRLRALSAKPQRADPASGNVRTSWHVMTAHGTLLAADQLGRAEHIPSGSEHFRFLSVAGRDVEAAFRPVVRGLDIVWLGQTHFLAQRNGRFLCATPNGRLVIDRTEASDWEVFRLVPA